MVDDVFGPNDKGHYSIYGNFLRTFCQPNLYITLRRSRDRLLTWFVSFFLRQSVSQSLASFRCFGPTLRYADTRIVNIMKVWVLHRKEQLASRVNTIPYININFIHVYFCEAWNSMQRRPPNANLESDSQTVYIFSCNNACRNLLVVRGRTWPTLAGFRVDCGHDKRILLVTQLHYRDTCIVNNYDQSVHRNEQLATRINTIQYKMLTLFTFAFAK